MTTAIETTTATKTEHKIPGALLQKNVLITVVGCGGTGSAIAAGLPYLHQAIVALGHPHGLDVTLVDGDRISRTNCVRQPFSESEIGLHKATVLATRINLFWGLGWKGVPHFVDESWGHETDILIGCVDSRAARNAMTRTQTYWNCHYWLDLGNNADSGQFVLGQPENQRNKARDLRLPTASELFPELINAKLDKKDRLPPCSALEALERQEPFVNQTLAYQALAMLARLFRYGRLSYHGGFVNLRTGRTTSLAVDPVLWQRMRTQLGRFRITQTQEKEGGQAMSQSFRAVKEIWNVHSSCFIEPEKLIVLLHDLAARVGTASDEHEYGDKQAVWLENGRKVLDYMEADERFSAASFKDSMEEQGIAVNRNDLITLIDNMRSLSKQWRSSIGKHGELVFYIDAC